jgi:hypothetical protein
VGNQKVGRVVYYRLPEEFPEPLLATCVRQLLALTSELAADEPDASSTRSTPPQRNGEPA